MSHVESIVSKANTNLGLVKWMARSFWNTSTCVLLFKDLARIHLEQALVI